MSGRRRLRERLEHVQKTRRDGATTIESEKPIERIGADLGRAAGVLGADDGRLVERAGPAQSPQVNCDRWPVTTYGSEPVG